jgi:DNA end-binding protein Ku
MSSTRSIGSADIKFGFVSIPIKLYVAASPDKFSFNFLTAKGNRIKQITTDSETGEMVEYSTLNKGVEVEKDKYVIFTKDDFENLSGEKENVIEICEIIPNTISPEDVEKSVYIAPDKSDKSYRLLHRCLAADNNAAICKYYTTSKDHLVAICAAGELLIMYQLYYKCERRELGLNFSPSSEPSDGDIELGLQLLDQYRKPTCDLGAYKDEYASRVQSAVEKKRAGIVGMPREKGKKNSGLGDLSSLLKASLKRSRK